MNNSLSKYLRKSGLIFLFISPVFFINTGDKYWIDLLTFYILIIQSTMFVFLPKEEGATVFKTYFVFSYIFFGIVPLSEFVNGVVYWGGGEILDVTYIKTNMLLFFVNTSYFVIYKFTKVKFKVPLEVDFKSYPYSKLNGILFVLLSVVSFFIVYSMNGGSIISMIFRGGDYKQVVEVDRWVGSILGTLFRFIPAMILILIVNDTKVSKVLKFIIFVFCFLCASPFGMARFMVALLYLPLILIILPKLRLGDNLPLILMGSLALVFPFLENFRNFNGLDSLSFIPKYDFFFSGHFDSYQSLARVLQSDFITFGNQLLGSIFFFIPRLLWESKPIGSGAYVANVLNYDFTNVSMNFYGEGYINFGYIGVILFVIIFAVMSSYVDAKYKVINVKEDINTQVILPYLIYIALVFTLMRGDLNVAISLFVSIMTSFYVVKLSMKMVFKSDSGV